MFFFYMLIKLIALVAKALMWIVLISLGYGWLWGRKITDRL